MHHTPSYISIKIIFITNLLFIFNQASAQYSKVDSVDIDYNKIYGYGLQANINQALILLKVDTAKLITQKDKEFIKNFNNASNTMKTEVGTWKKEDLQ